MQATATTPASPTRSPKVRIAIPSKAIRKTFALPQSQAETLTQYAEFLSAYHASRVSEETILESLLSRLSRDKAFRAWQTQRQA
jgi:hypothetical protein